MCCAVRIPTASVFTHTQANVRFENREPKDRPGTRDLAPQAFRVEVMPLVKRLAKGAATRRSDFYREFSSKQSGEVLRRHPCGPFRVPCNSVGLMLTYAP